ncbi:MAG: hypothetical protein JEZ00_07285 [Anaerolineaceae bacterium]|nr:hypothetical protein [Anaerolineaceae bacterium]
MLNKFSNRLYASAKGWGILALIVGFVLFFSITLSLLPTVIPASETMVSLDDPVFYTPEQVFSILGDWEATGRIQQLWFHMTWDVIVPVWSFLIIGLSSSWLLMRGFTPDNKWRKLNLVAFVSAFDLLENFSLAALILVYPAQPAWLAWLKTGFTMTKYACGVLIIGVLLVGLIGAVRNKFRVLV